MNNADETVRALREMLPPQVDYAELVCAESWAHGQHYVWEDPEPYIISEAADLIESLKACLARVTAERDAAVADIRSMETQRSRPFEPKPCGFCTKIDCYCSSGGSACKGFEWRGVKGGAYNE